MKNFFASHRFNTLTTSVLLLCVIPTFAITIPHVFTSDVTSKDDLSSNNWVRLSLFDHFDSDETTRLLYFTSDKSEIFIFRRTNDETTCNTDFSIRVPLNLLSEDQNKSREKQRSAARSIDLPIVPVSFNFKQHGSDDLKILDVEFEDSTIHNSESMFVVLQNDAATDLKPIITALRDSHEVRVKADLYDFRFDLKVNVQSFKKQYTHLSEFCKDEEIDLEDQAEQDT